MESVSLVHKQEEREQRSLDKLTRHPQKACNDPTGGGGRENNCAIVRLLIPIAQAKLSLAAGFRSWKAGWATKIETRLARFQRHTRRRPPLLERSARFVACRHYSRRHARVNLSMNYDCSRGRSFTPRKKLLPQRGSISMIVRIVRITKPLFPRVWELSLSSCYLFIFSSLLKIIELERSCRGIIFRYSWKRLINYHGRRGKKEERNNRKSSSIISTRYFMRE